MKSLNYLLKEEDVWLEGMLMHMRYIMAKNRKVYIALIGFNAVSKLPAPRVDSRIVRSNPLNNQYNMVCMRLEATTMSIIHVNKVTPSSSFFRFKSSEKVPTISECLASFRSLKSLKSLATLRNLRSGKTMGR